MATAFHEALKEKALAPSPEVPDPGLHSKSPKVPASVVIALAEGQEILVPPFPFRQPSEEESAPDYLEWFVEELDRYMTSLWRQVRPAKRGEGSA